jgi:putative ABC transport system ATP-binding protein
MQTTTSPDPTSPILPTAALPAHPVRALELDDLWRIYNQGTRAEVQALRGVSLKVDPGSFVALKGRSGSGKTTLINVVGGLDRPTRGTVHVFGYEPYSLNEKELTHFRREQVGFIFQSFGLSTNYSAYENIELMLRIKGVPMRQRRERVMYCLDLVGLEKWKNHRPDELSGGQQQRVAIARALVNQPKLILADEPTGDLDSGTAKEILAIFRRIVAEEKVTLFISSHDPVVEEYVDRTLNLSDGQVVSDSHPLDS